MLIFVFQIVLNDVFSGKVSQIGGSRDVFGVSAGVMGGSSRGTWEGCERVISTTGMQKSDLGAGLDRGQDFKMWPSGRPMVILRKCGARVQAFLHVFTATRFVGARNNFCQGCRDNTTLSSVWVCVRVSKPNE